MSPKEQARFIETLLSAVHDALAAGHRLELHISFDPGKPPIITLLPPVPHRGSSSYYRQQYGMSLREMAQQYHRSITTVWRWIKQGWKPKGGTP